MTTPVCHYERIVGNASAQTLETLRALAGLLGAPESDSESSHAWAAKRLSVPRAELAAIDHVTSATAIAVLGHIFGGHIAKHQEIVSIGGTDDGEPPTWAPLQLGAGSDLMVPGRLIAHFPAGSLSQAAMCISIDNISYSRELKIYVRNTDRDAAQSVMSEFLSKVRSDLNPYRGHVLEASTNSHSLLLSVAPSLAAPRESLILPEHLWREIDVFIAAATAKRQIMRDLGLGTTRGILLAGPPGTGKTHLARVLAAELVGDDASTMRTFVRELYGEAETFGPLVVILEDIDLIVGHRDQGASPDSLADFLAALDGIRQLADVYTIATTNDAGAIDPAAQRTARFDTILTLPKPGHDERTAILAAYLSPLGLEVDLSVIATVLDGCTGSDIREVVRRAVLEHGTELTTAQLSDVAGSGRWRPQPATGQYL